MNEALQTAEKLSRYDDRFLFIFVLIILLGAGGYIIRHLNSRNEKLMEDHEKSRNEFHKSLVTITSDQAASNQKLVHCLDRNSQSLESNTVILEKTQLELQLCRESRSKH